MATCAGAQQTPADPAQQAPVPATPQPQPQSAAPQPADKFLHPNESKFFIHLADDQKNIWTSPFHLKPADAKWLVPVSGIATGLFVTDPQSSYAMRLDHQHPLNLASDAGVGAAMGLTGAAYVWGRITHNERARETGVLATEAMINAFGVDYALKGITGRERPFPSNFQNIFFHGGTSLPSDHAAVTWAFASVVAQEYPHPAAEFGAYGLALGVSLARAAADQHFLSDVFIGGLMGYQIGRQIYKNRHNPEIDDDLKIVAEETSAPRPTNSASVNVPLDSWIYPAMERLIGGGYIDTAFLGLRPWSRMSCAKMLIEMNEKVEYHTDVPSEIWQLKKTLDQEFAPEIATWDGHPTESIQLDSVYTQVMNIAGKPVNDSYHFGQTLINDYGRPYWQGWNNITGFSASANDGRFAFYVDGEYQYSPTIPGYPLSVRQVIANGRSESAAASDSGRRQSISAAEYVCHHEIRGPRLVGRQAKHVVGAQRGRRPADERQRDSFLGSADQSSWSRPTFPCCQSFLGPFETANFFGALDGHQFPAGPLHVWAEGQL